MSGKTKPKENKYKLGEIPDESRRNKDPHLQLSPNASTNNLVFNLDLNRSTDSTDRSSRGSSFHTSGRNTEGITYHYG